MPTINGIVTQAATRMIPRRDGTGEFPLYEVWLDGQGPFVARKDIYGQAERLLHQHVEAITRDEQKGSYLNHYLDFIAPLGGQASSVPTQAPLPPPQAQQAQTAAQVMSQPNPVEERRQLSIERQKATDIAATLANLSGNVSPLVYWENVQALVRFYATGEVPSVLSDNPGVPRQNADAYKPYQENQFVPDNAYHEQPPPHTDDDIPF